MIVISIIFIIALIISMLSVVFVYREIKPITTGDKLFFALSAMTMAGGIMAIAYLLVLTGLVLSCCL